MPYEYVEGLSVADIAFRARSKTLDGLFRDAADATMNVMVEELDTIRPLTSRDVQLEDDELDMLLFEFLQELIYFKDAEQLLLRPEQVCIDKSPDHGYRLRARLVGEPLDRQRHPLRVDVKAVTLHCFELKRTDPGWEVQVVLDI